MRTLFSVLRQVILREITEIRAEYKAAGNGEYVGYFPGKNW